MRIDPVLEQQIFEVRFEHGYRYLDTCGEVMLILEDLLSQSTKCLWMPRDAAPQGAHLISPQLDMHVVFNAFHLVVDQNPVGDTKVDFSGIAADIFATIKGRLRIGAIRRFGGRQLCVIGTDSLEDAEVLSTKLTPCPDWNSDKRSQEFKPLANEQVVKFETSDHSKGIRIATRPFAKHTAEVKLDERLKVKPHLLPEGQHEALREQLKRQKQREKDPQAGVMIDIDYYWTCPEDDSVSHFIKEAWTEINRELDFVKSKGS